MDFSKVKSLLIPQGKVKDISVAGVKVWGETSEQYIIEKGTYLFNDFIEPPFDTIENPPLSKEYNFAFTSNGTTFSKIRFTVDTTVTNPTVDFVKMYYDDTLVWSYQTNGDSEFTQEAYKTIVLSENQTVLKEFYDWWTLWTTKQTTPTYTVSGVWVFNDTITLNFSSNRIYQSVSFTSNNKSFIDFTIGSFNFENEETGQRESVTNGIVYGTDDIRGIKVNENYHWLSSAYKTVDFGSTPQAVSKEYAEWLPLNARKRITFTIDGTSYQAYDGMTWKDWVDSEFNTNNYYMSGSFICYDVAGLGTYAVQDSLGKSVLYSDLIISEYIYALVSTDVCCFVAGTPVLMADGSFKDIETVVVGDEVLTFNEETLSYEKGVVVRTITKKNTRDMARLNLSDGTSIVMNAYHPICTNNGWKSLTQHKGMPLLEVGDLALSTNGTYIEILSIERWIEEPPITTYNLDIENNDNFFAGETAIAVHNGDTSAC